MAEESGMGKINWGRVFLCGLLAGVVINVGDIAFHWVILGTEWWFFKAFARPVGQAVAAVLPFVTLHLLAGIAAIWLYAVARPRFGPGPKTAVYVGFGY